MGASGCRDFLTVVFGLTYSVDSFVMLGAVRKKKNAALMLQGGVSSLQLRRGSR
jgi:hypothetical protein